MHNTSKGGEGWEGEGRGATARGGEKRGSDEQTPDRGESAEEEERGAEPVQARSAGRAG